jgi:hypothetical protein
MLVKSHLRLPLSTLFGSVQLVRPLFPLYMDKSLFRPLGFGQRARACGLDVARTVIGPF